MTTLEREAVVSAESLRAFAAALLERVEVPPEDAALTAETLVEADLRGVTSHGTRALPGYLARLRAGGTRARPRPRVVRQGPAFALMDGDAGLGQVVAHRAMRLAIELARRSGLGAVSVENSNHYGAAAFYPMMAAAEGMIGLATTNGGGKNMAAFDGAEPVVGNSPLAFAAPAGEEPPIVLDMATGVVAAGKISVAAMRGEPIPLGWALDAQGEPTEDPSAARIVLPLGPKGYGLAMMLDVLCGPLRGGPMSVNTRGPRTDERPSGAGHFFLALDVGQFTDLAAFRAELDRGIRAVRASRPRRGAARVYLPGEIEALNKERCLREGVPLHPGHAGPLAALGRELGVPPPWDGAA
jgi:LDH2 family malate/lactate/ureidoglycolate dehydrogenase